MAKTSAPKETVETPEVDLTVPANPIEPAQAGKSYTLPDGTVVTHN
jgi:hypothetical protein